MKREESTMSAEEKILEYNQHMMDNVFNLGVLPKEPNPIAQIELGDDPFLLIDVYGKFQNGDQGDIFNEPVKPGYVVNYVRISGVKYTDAALIEFAQDWIDKEGV